MKHSNNKRKSSLAPRIFIFFVAFAILITVAEIFIYCFATRRNGLAEISRMVEHGPFFIAGFMMNILIFSMLATLLMTRFLPLSGKKSMDFTHHHKSSPLRDAQGKGREKDMDELTTTTYDIITEKVNEIRIDPLTCAYTKPYIVDTLTHALLFSQTGKQSISVVQFSVDHFQDLLTQHGQDVGHNLLQQISVFVQSHALRPRDALGCLSENCFIWLLLQTRADETHDLCHKLKDMLHKNDFKCGTETFHPSLSMGVANLNSYIVDAASMLEAAETAHHQAATQNAGKIVYSQGSLPKHMTIVMDF